MSYVLILVSYVLILMSVSLLYIIQGMAKTNFIALLLFILLVLYACTDSFEEINANPNNPTTVTPDLLLAGIERDMMTVMVSETWEIGNLVVQHTAKNTSTNVDRYIWGERNQIWNAVYDNMRDVNNILLQTSDENGSNYRAIALILRAWMFSLVTDCYGDVPYSEAIQGKRYNFAQIRQSGDDL